MSAVAVKVVKWKDHDGNMHEYLFDARDDVERFALQLRIKGYDVAIHVKKM